MLIGSKKVSKNEKDWFVVLKNFQNEIDKKKLLKKIEQAFSVTHQEASDLVDNTPIILLDQLPHDIGIQVQRYFDEAGAEIELSNDGFLRRRCYRTVWPSKPSLSFLNQSEGSVTESAGPEKLSGQDALDELRRNEPQNHLPKPTHENQREDIKPSNEVVGNEPDRKALEAEKDRLLKEYLVLQEEMDLLRKSEERSQRELLDKDRAYKDLEESLKVKEKENHEARALLANSEEKNEILKEEFRDTRSYFEERLLSYEKKIKELEARTETLKKMNEDVLGQKAEFERRGDEYREKIEVLEREKAQGVLDWENRSADLKHELNIQKRLNSDLNEKITALELSKKSVQSTESELRREVEKQALLVKEKELSNQELIKEVSKLKEGFKREEDQWQMKVRELNLSVEELHAAKRQIDELRKQLECRELIQKKAQLAEQLSAKEMRLGSLVKRQEQLEKEAHAREAEMRRLLEDQEKIENSIIEDKQMQKNIFESLKKGSSISSSEDDRGVSEPLPATEDPESFNSK